MNPFTEMPEDETIVGQLSGNVYCLSWIARAPWPHAEGRR